MREVLETGSSSSFGKSSRALLSYINSIRLHSDTADIANEHSAASSNALQHSEKVLSNESCVVDLRIRDLRLLDVNFYSNDIYSIVVRKHSVLLSLDPFKVVVMSDRIVIVVSPQKKAEENMDHILRMFENHFKGSWRFINTYQVLSTL